MLGYIWNRALKKIRGKAVKNSIIDKSSKIEAGSTVLDTFFDKYSFCGYDCKINNCEVGAYCSIADGVVIGVAEHPIDWVSTSPVFYKGRDSIKKKFSEFERSTSRRTYIGNDVWIGERAFVKAGVRIGNGAVVGMGAVVTHDVKPYEIVAGVPAKHVRYRFEEQVRMELEKTEWWLFSDKKLEEYAKCIKDPKRFIWEINEI